MDLDIANTSAREHRSRLPARNAFAIKELGAMPPLFDWVDCVSGHASFKMFLAGPDDGVALRFFWNGTYEGVALKAWTRVSTHCDVALDVGAHTGVYTLAALAATTKLRVISFEPHFMNFARLNLNMRANGFSTKFAFMNAVGAKTEVLPFSVSTTPDYLTSGGSVGTRQNAAVHQVPVVALDTFLSQDVSAKVGLVKLDVEGFEGECLAGMEKIIASRRPVIFFECMETKSASAVEKVLGEYGYKFLIVDEEAGTVSPIAALAPCFDGNGRLIRARLNRIAFVDESVSAILMG